MPLLRAAQNLASRIFGQQGPKLVRDLASLASGQLTSMLLGFLTFAYLARVLKPEAYGAVEYAIAVAALAAIVIECGAGTIGVRELAKQPERGRELATSVPAARFIMAVLVAPLAALSTWLAGMEGTTATLVCLYALSLLAVPFKQDWLLQGFERMSQNALAQPIRTAVFAAGIFLFVHETSDLVTVGVVELAAVTAMAFFFLVAQHRWAAPFQWPVPLSTPLFLLREGAAVGLSNGLWVFMLYAPMIMLTSLAGTGGAAWLGAAQRLVISLVTLSFVYHFNLYPVITRTVSYDRGKWGRIMAASARLVAWAGIGLALVLTLLSADLMTFVYGAPFAAGATALSILIWMFPLRMLTGHGRWSLIAAGHQRYLLLGEIAGAIVLLTVGFFAIPALEAAGGALALVSGIFISGFVTQVAVNRLVGPLSLFRYAGMPLAAALGGLAVAHAIDGSAWLQAAAGLAVYGLVALTQIRTGLADMHTIAFAKADKPEASN